MKTFISKLCLSFSIVWGCAILLSSCSNEDDSKILDNNHNQEELYNKLRSSFKYKSFIPSQANVLSNDSVPLSGNINDDLNYLSGLSEEEFKAFLDELYIIIGGENMQVYEDISYNNYMRIFEIMGGHDGMDQLTDFLYAYMWEESGWDSIQALLPMGLTEQQTTVYIAMAVYIDEIARPTYFTIIGEVSEGDETTDPLYNESYCKWELGLALIENGVKIGVEAFLEIMTGGGATEEVIPEGIEIGLDVVEAWLDYERCCGRWH